MDIKFDWDDISIVPSTLSDISSRSEIEIQTLPIFTAPMDMVIDENNINYFEKNKINICLPRNIKYNVVKNQNYFYSYGLDEIVSIIDNDGTLPNKVLIDIANGHMKKLYDVSKVIKEKYKNVQLMIGNIANPETYREYCKIGVDLIRVGIGGGCFTPNSLVMTENGLKKIKDVSTGDKVITHKNRLREVIQKHTFDRNETFIKVNGIECTKNHEFYVILKSDRQFINDTNIENYAFWVESSKLNKDLHLLIKF